MISELDLLNALKEVGIGILFLVGVWRLTSAGMQFMDRRAAADERRAVSDDALMTRLLKSTEQQVDINGKHAEFQAGILKAMGELSHQIVAATATITQFSTAVSKTIGGLLDAISDGNATLAGQFDAALGQKTDLALQTIARVQQTADAISTGQSEMQGQIHDLAKTIIGVADGMRALQQLEETRENADEQFRGYLRRQLDVLTQTLSSAEQTLVALSNQSSHEDEAESAGKETQNEAVDVVGVGAVGDAV